MVKVIRAKLHGLRVTGADLHYHGSITLDPEHGALAGLYPCEFVEIWNKNSGARLSTYVIYGESGSGVIQMNGAAAHIIKVGEEIIIMGFELGNETLPQKIILVDKQNKFVRYLPPAAS